MTRARIAAFYFFILSASLAAGAAKTDDYAQSWPLNLSGDSAAWQIELTPEIYAAISDPQLRDMEVLDGAGNPVPIAPYAASKMELTPATLMTLPAFKLPVAPAGAQNADDESIRLHIERGADGKLRRLDAEVGTINAQASGKPAGNAGASRPLPPPDPESGLGEILLDASALHAPLDILRLDWADDGASVSAQFAISASDDLQQWHTLNPSATVMRLKQEGNVLNRHEVALNGVHAKYLRLRRLDDGGALPYLVAQARTLELPTLAQPARQWLEATLDGSDTQHQDHTLPVGDGNRPVAWRYHLPAALAISSLKLDLAGDNSLAVVHALCHIHTSPAGSWLEAANFIAFRLRQGDTLLGNDEVSFLLGGRASEWRIELGTPLDQPPRLRVAYLPDRFVFLAQGAGPYRLVAGSVRTRRADYPIDAALATLRTSLGQNWQPPLAALGARTTLQGERAMTPAPVPETPRDWTTWLLWAVLAGAAALIGAMALSLLRGGSKPDNGN